MTEIFNALIDVREDKTVCIRELHRFLGVSTRWDTWIFRRIDEFGFIQGVDFTALKNEHNEIKELRSTLDMAKELCMVEKNDRGREARKYFIEVEKRWHAERANKTKAELLLEQVQILVEQERKVKELATRQDTLEVKVDMLSAATGFRTIRGHARMNKVSLTEIQAADLGRKARKQCLAKDLTVGKVKDERHGQVNTYPIEILEPIFETWLMENL